MQQAHAARQTTGMPAIKPGKLLIDGKWVDAQSGKRFETLNPATEAVLTTVAEGDAADVEIAVRAARRALEHGPWATMSARERGRLLYKLADLVAEHRRELAVLDTLDKGKPIRESYNVDAPQAAEVLAYYGGWADKICGDTIPVSGPFFNYTRREPVGVVGQIIPWNFPLLMAAWKLGPALACGNTVVLKPAEQTPLSALRLGELIQEAGFPDGVVNIVTGFGPTAGGALVRHPDVDKIAFTGSTEVGKLIHRESGDTLKRVSLELGGKAPNIVFADADMEAAARGAIGAIFFNQGEVCCAGSRLFVEDDIHDEFVSVLAGYAKSIKVGDPLDEATEMGAQVSEEQFTKILGYIESGKRDGASIVTGGRRATDRGYFVEPTVFDGVRNDMQIAREEIFGPVVATLRFDDVDSVVRLGNDTAYGLSAGVWTRDIGKAHRVAHALKAGTVWVNCFNAFDTASPFGGYKQSGYGRELGEYALDLYTQTKSVWVAL
jgi:aldehyde dehydrogenase (NAD+)